MGGTGMTQQELDKAKNKDLAASLIAMRRAARMAREVAVRTDTAIVVAHGQTLVHVTSAELRAQGIR